MLLDPDPDAGQPIECGSMRIRIHNTDMLLLNVVGLESLKLIFFLFAEYIFHVSSYE
jgi:hypothetical protein